MLAANYESKILLLDRVICIKEIVGSSNLSQSASGENVMVEIRISAQGKANA